ncbi:MAG: hypothetical protein L3I99_05475 [Sulfurimonas sp.]|nr:hypothetical protein [Sulfurimonas sp.]
MNQLEKLTEKLEEKYGFTMSKKEVMEVMKVSLSTLKVMENKKEIIRLNTCGKIKYLTERVAQTILQEE